MNFYTVAPTRFGHLLVSFAINFWVRLHFTASLLHVTCPYCNDNSKLCIIIFNYSKIKP